MADKVNLDITQKCNYKHHIFINHTNHTSANWSEEQRLAAEVYGTIVDLALPEMHPEYDEAQIEELARASAAQILALRPVAVLCQGEFTYSFALVRLLQAQGITVLAACSERRAQEEWQGNVSRKVSYFQFVQFRRYPEDSKLAG